MCIVATSEPERASQNHQPTEQQQKSRMILDIVYFTFSGTTLCLTISSLLATVLSYLLKKEKSDMKALKIMDAFACIIGLGLSITLAVLSPQMKVGTKKIGKKVNSGPNFRINQNEDDIMLILGLIFWILCSCAWLANLMSLLIQIYTRYVAPRLR